MNVKKYFSPIMFVPLVIGMVIVIGWFALDNYSKSKYDEGFLSGLVQGRREVVDAILINIANEGNVVIRQADQSITLVLEGRTLIPKTESKE